MRGPTPSTTPVDQTHLQKLRSQYHTLPLETDKSKEKRKKVSDDKLDTTSQASHMGEYSLILMVYCYFFLLQEMESKLDRQGVATTRPLEKGDWVVEYRGRWYYNVEEF